MRSPETGRDRYRFAVACSRSLRLGTKLEARECVECERSGSGLFQIVRRTPPNSETRCIDRRSHARDYTQTIHWDCQAESSPASSVLRRLRSGIETCRSAPQQRKSGNAALRTRDLSDLRCMPRHKSTSRHRLREIAASAIRTRLSWRDGPAKTHFRPQFSPRNLASAHPRITCSKHAVG